MKLKSVYIALTTLITLSSACLAEDTTGYHRPQTEAERALEHILQKDRAGDVNMRGYLIQYPERDISKDENYANLFTQRLVKEISAFEKKLVSAQCNGEYTGELCGYDASYLSCSQDAPDEYLYRTQQEIEDKEATIRAIWSPLYTGSVESKTTYHLTKHDGNWRLDGVICANGDAFNASAFVPKPN